MRGIALGLVACLLGGLGCERLGALPDVVLITVDTLRADHLGCYGYRHETSPNIDAFAARGVRFADASVQWPSTWPSMASMLTGTYPAQTGVRHTPYVSLASKNRTIAERLQPANYQTAAIVSNANLGFKMAFDQGFDHFVEAWMEEFRRQTGETEYRNRPGRVKQFTDAARVTDQALSWLASRDKRRPFFLWVHYMDPHGPYLPPESYRDLFPDGYAEHRVPVRLIPEYQQQKGPDQEVITDLGFYTRRYDQEIRYLDTELSRLLDALDALPASPLIVLSADHGESLAEHGYYLEHGATPYQPNARVPLVLVHEGVIPAGQVVERPVGLVQLVPTLLELVGLAVPSALPAPSLTPLFDFETGDAAERAAPAPYDVYLQAGANKTPQRIVRRGPWKLVHVADRRDQRLLRRPEYLLYNLQDDPGERKNVAPDHPALVAQMKQSLDRWEGSLLGANEGVSPELSEAERQMLEQLGYVIE